MCVLLHLEYLLYLQELCVCVCVCDIQQYYGYNIEEEWIQIYPVSGGVVYFSKVTGRVQTDRPEEYRPYLKVCERERAREREGGRERE